MLVMTRFSMRSRTATHSLATLSIIARICSVPLHAYSFSLYMQLTACQGEHVNFPQEIRIRVTVALHFLQSRGDKTAIELFVAGVRGWEAGLRRYLAPSADGK